MPIFLKDASVVGDIIRLGAERTLVQISIMTLDVGTVLSLGKVDYFLCPHPIYCMHTCKCTTFNGFTIQGRGGIITSYIMQSREKKGISNGYVCHVVLEVKPGIWHAHKDLFWLTINILFLLPVEKAWDSSTRWESSSELQEDLPGSVGKQWWCHKPPICRYCCSEGKEWVSCHWKGLSYNYRGTSRQHYQKWSLVFW